MSGKPNTSKNDRAAAPTEAAAAAISGSMTTKEEWHDFVNTEPPAKPAMPSAEELRSWTPERVAAFNERRADYHLRLPPVVVPAMARIHSELMPLIEGNPLKSPGARRGGIIDGTGGVGKTTNITQLGRSYERLMRRKYPNPRTLAGEEYIPVVYVTLSSETTIKGLSIALARFYGAVFSTRATKDEIGYAVIDHARRCVTTLILVDDIHFLNVRSKDGRAVNDHLKFLANSINATFVYAGIECEWSGLLSEGYSNEDARFSQMRRRFGLHRVEPFSTATAESTAEWRMFLKTVENRLALRGSFDGMLSGKLADYLFRRTGGYIGALTELVGRGASIAIDSREEKITRKTLDPIALDYAAERESARRSGKGKRKVKPDTAIRLSAYAAPRPKPKESA